MDNRTITEEDLRWHISNAYCAGNSQCGCSQDEIDEAKGKCWDFANKIMEHRKKNLNNGY